MSQTDNQSETQNSIACYSIKLVKESALLYNGQRVTDAKNIVELLMSMGMHERASEEFYTLYLDTKNHVVGMEMISRGTLNASLIHPREVFKGAILANAKSIILAHNHPSGDTEPSSSDKNVTENLVKAGKLLDLRVLDHVIVGRDGDYFSFRDSSMIVE